MQLHLFCKGESTMNQIIKDLWEDYRKAVKEYGYGKESKEVLIKIYSLRRENKDAGSS